MRRGQGLLRPLGRLGRLGRLVPLRPLRPLRRLGVLGVLGVLGCSQDAVEEVTPVPVEDLTPIAFSGNMQEETAVTRAGLETEGAELFTVYGYKNMSLEGESYTDPQLVFPGYTVKWVNSSAASTTTNSSGWEYANQELLGQVEQTVKYWDWTAKAYRFFGITETYDKLDGEVINNAFKLTFNVDLTNKDGIKAVPYYSHLWFSNNNYEDYPSRKFGDRVELEFLRPICSVCIMFIYEDPANNRTNTPLEDINFHRTDDVTIKQKGDVTISYPLAGAEKTETCTFDTEASGITGFTKDYVVHDPLQDGDKFSYTVLPITDQGTYTLDITVDGDPKTAIVPAAYMDWMPGYKYTYIFKIHVDGSVAIDAVQSAFTGWRITAKDYTVYNW